MPSHTVTVLGRGVGRVRELEKGWNSKQQESFDFQSQANRHE